MADIAFSVGIHTDEARAGHDQIIAWNKGIAASYGAIEAAAAKASKGLSLGAAANANIAGMAGLEKAVNALSASVAKLAQQQEAWAKAAQAGVKAATDQAQASRKAAQDAETEAQAIDRITQRLRDAKAAREADKTSTEQQAKAHDALAASIARGAGGQVSNAGLLSAADASKKAADEAQKLAKAHRDEEAASNAAVQSADRLVKSYAPMIQAQRQLAADKEAFTKLQQAGTLSAAEEAAVMAGLEARTKNLTAMQQALGGSTKAQAAHFQSLKYQLNDVISGLIMGQPPMMIFVQQGGQIVQALQGMDISLKTVRPGVLAIGAGIATVTVAAVAGVIAWSRYTSSVNDAANAVRLTGNAIGMSRDQVVAFSDAVADASGVSSASVRSMVTEYTKLGGIGPSVMSGLVAITKDYAAATGQGKDEAAAALGAMFKDPAKGAEELASKYNLLTGAQLDNIRRLVEAGQKTQAQAVLTEALGQRIKGAADQTSIWARAWDAVATGASNAADAVGRAVNRAVNGKSLDERIAEARDVMLKARQATTPRTGGIIANQKAFDEQTAELKEEADRATEAYNRLMDEKREQNRAAATQGIATRNNEASRAALETTNRYNELGATIRNAEKDMSTLQKGVGPLMGQAAAQGEVAIERLKNQITDLSKVQASGVDLQTYKAQQLAAVEQRAASMSGPAREKFLAQKRAEIEAFGSATTAAERNAQVSAAVGQASASIATSSADAVMQINLQTAAQNRLAEAAGQGEAAMRRAAIENKVAEASVKGLGDATRKALEEQEAATRRNIHAEFAASIGQEVAATGRLVEAMSKGAVATREAEIHNAAYLQTIKEISPTEKGFGDALQRNIALLNKKADASDSKAFADYGKQVEAQTRQLELQQKLVGATPQQAGRLRVEADISELLIRQGRTYESLTDAERRVIDAAKDRAVANADMEVTIQRQQDAYQTLANSLEKAFDRVGDALVDAFVRGEGKAINFGAITKGILASLLSDMLKMAVVNPFSNAVFGTNRGTLFDLAGPANQNGGMGGAGNLLSGASGLNALSGGGLMDKLFPGGGFSLTGSIDSFGMGMGFGPGTNFVGPMLPGTQGIFGGASLSQFLGGAGLGFGAGSLLNSLVGGNAVGGTVGSGVGGLAGAAIGSIVPGVGTLLGGLIGGAGGGLLGGMFGNNKPSNMEGNVAIDFLTGKTTVGGQTGEKYSAENRQAAQTLGGQVQQLATTLEALLPGQQIKGSGLIAVGSRDGLRAEYGGQKAEFGKEDTAGLVDWFTKQFSKDMKDGFERGDLPQQVASNLQKVLDKGITGTVEQFVADMTLASTDFAKAFDSVAKAQPDQIAGQVAEVTSAFIAMRDGAGKLGLAVDGLAESADKATSRLIDASTRQAQGRTYIDSASTIRETFEKVGQSLLGAGQSGDKAVKLYGAQMSALVNSLGTGTDALKALSDMAESLSGIDDTAVLFARTRAEQVRAAVQEDLTMRQMQAQVQLGQVSQEAYDLAMLEVQQKRELAGVTDDAVRAQLAQVQATERQVLASQAAAKAAQTAAEAQKAFASSATSTRSYLLSLMTGEAGGLSAKDRYANAQGEYAAATAAIGPQATAEQLTRQTEAAKAFIEASRAVNGSTTAYFSDLANITSDLAKSAQLKPDDPVVTAINTLKASVDSLGGKVNVQVTMDSIKFIRGEIEQTIKTYVSYSGLSDREIQLANGLLDDVKQSVTVALSPTTGMTARELQVYQGALSNLDQSITAAVDTSALTGANREIALGQLSDAARTINAALGQFPTMTDSQREFVLGASRDFARTVNGVLGAMPNLSTEQQAILLGQTGSFSRTFNALAAAAPTLSAEQSKILSGVSDSFTRSFNSVVAALPSMTAEQRAILLGQNSVFMTVFQGIVADLPSMSDEQRAILLGITDSFTRTFSAATTAMPALSDEQRSVLLGQTESFSRTFNAVAGAVPNLSTEQAKILSGVSDSFTRSFNSAVAALPAMSAEQRAILLGQNGVFVTVFQGVAADLPSMSDEQRAILLGVTDSFSRTFKALTDDLPSMSSDQRAILLGVSDSFTRLYQQAVGTLPSMSAEQQAILTGITGSFTKTFQSAASALPSLSADQLAVLRGKTEDFTKTFIAATNDLVLSDDEKAVLSAKDATIRQTIDQYVNRDVTETVSTTVMRELTQGFQVIQLQATSVLINKLDAVGKLVYEAGLNTVRAITGNWQWGNNVTSAGPTVLTTREAEYLARYSDLADAWAANPNWSPAEHYRKYGAAEGRTFQNGGVVGSYEDGGVVGNGVRGVDSVLARYAGGGYIELAGQEGVLTADATSAIGGAGTVDYINRNHRLPMVANMNRPAMRQGGDDGAVVAELRELRKEVADLRRENTKMIQNQALMEDAAVDRQTATLVKAVAPRTGNQRYS